MQQLSIHLHQRRGQARVRRACQRRRPRGSALEENKYKPKDESLKSHTFKEEHYCAFFQYLVDTDRVDAEDGVGIHVTEKAKRRAGKYLDANDLMPTWVSEHYDDAHASEKAFVAIKDLFVEFKASDHYQNLSKRERTLMNEKKFRSAISKSAKVQAKVPREGEGDASATARTTRRMGWST